MSRGCAAPEAATRRGRSSSWSSSSDWRGASGRFAHLAVLVRWNGGWVRSDRLRQALIDILEPVSVKARQLTRTAIDGDDQTDRLARALTATGGQGGATKLMRRRLHHAAEDIERALYAFAALATNGRLEWENHDPENPTEPLVGVVERALGIDRARTDDIAGNGALMRGPESSQQILGELQAAGTFDLLNLEAAFTSASDEMIERAFDDAIACAGVLVDVFDAIQVIAGDDIAGLASFSEIAPGADAIKVALLVRGLLLMRPLLDEGALESVLQAARNAGPQLQAASELARALPQYKAFVGRDGAERLAALPRTERARVIGEVRAYLETKPELVKLLENGS